MGWRLCGVWGMPLDDWRLVFRRQTPQGSEVWEAYSSWRFVRLPSWEGRLPFRPFLDKSLHVARQAPREEESKGSHRGWSVVVGLGLGHIFWAAGSFRAGGSHTELCCTGELSHGAQAPACAAQHGSQQQATEQVAGEGAGAEKASREWGRAVVRTGLGG